MGENEKMAKAVEDYNTFWILQAKQDKSVAYDLLKQVNLRLVKKHYKDEFKVNPKQEALFNIASKTAEVLKLKDQYEQDKADGGVKIEFFEEKEGLDHGDLS